MARGTVSETDADPRKNRRDHVSGIWCWLDAFSGPGDAPRMARALRIEPPGGWRHVTGRINERRDIFRTEQQADRASALDGEGAGTEGQAGAETTRK